MTMHIEYESVETDKIVNNLGLFVHIPLKTPCNTQFLKKSLIWHFLSSCVIARCTALNSLH